MNNYDFEQAVIELHNIARQIEEQMGIGSLSLDLRSCADRLAELIRKV